MSTPESDIYILKVDYLIFGFMHINIMKVKGGIIMKTGRPKKYVSLKKMNVHVEQSTLDLINGIVDMYNQKHGAQVFTFSYVVRKLLDTSAKQLAEHMSRQVNQNATGPDQFDPSTWKTD